MTVSGAIDVKNVKIKNAFLTFFFIFPTFFINKTVPAATICSQKKRVSLMFEQKNG